MEQPWLTTRWDNPGGITQVENLGGGQPRGVQPGETNPRRQPEEDQLFKIHCNIYCLISTIALEVIPPKGVDVNQECQCGEILEGNPNEGLLSIANLANKIVGGNPAEKVECT